jgi:hypothetical protein
MKAEMEWKYQTIIVLTFNSGLFLFLDKKELQVYDRHIGKLLTWNICLTRLLQCPSLKSEYVSCLSVCKLRFSHFLWHPVYWDTNVSVQLSYSAGRHTRFLRRFFVYMQNDTLPFPIRPLHLYIFELWSLIFFRPAIFTIKYEISQPSLNKCT